jgi:hypothetical protein
MSLEASEILKNVGELLKDAGLAVKTSSDGGKKITVTEWVEIGRKFATAMGADFIDDDED